MWSVVTQLHMIQVLYVLHISCTERRVGWLWLWVMPAPAPAPPSNPCLVTLQLDREQVPARAQPALTESTDTTEFHSNWQTNTLLAVVAAGKLNMDNENVSHSSLLNLFYTCKFWMTPPYPKPNEDHACRYSENAVGFPNSTFSLLLVIESAILVVLIRWHLVEEHKIQFIEINGFNLDKKIETFGLFCNRPPEAWICI